MKSHVNNTSCAACRLAKVKCIRHDPPTGADAPDDGGQCSRCTRLQLECVSEKRRSKWDITRTQPDEPPAGLASDPHYASLVSDLNKFKPIISTGLKPKCYANQVAPRLSRLIELALERDDSAALAFAVSHIELFRLQPSLFRQVLAGGSSSSFSPMDSPCDDEIESPRTVSPPHSLGWSPGPDPLMPINLPPYMAAHFNSDTQCMACIVMNGQKHFVANASCCLDLDRVRAAIGPIEQAQALGIPEKDALRLFEMYAATLTGLMDKCTSDPDPAGHGSELPPVLQQLQCKPVEGQQRKPTLHVLRSTVHVAADGETVFTFFRWVPLARSRGRKRRALPAAAAEAGAAADADGEHRDGPGAPDAAGGGFLGDYDLSTLLEEVGGEELLLRDLVAATGDA